MRKVLAALLLVVLAGCSSVGTGYRGVVLSWGHPTGEVTGEGPHLFMPFAGGIVPMNAQTQAYQVEADAASRDLQQVKTHVTLNYTLDPNQLPTIFEQLRNDYDERIIAPSIQEALKAATARYTASELITKRPDARNDLERNLADRLKPFGIRIVQLAITNFQFSDSFNAAIEAKVTSQQQLQQAQIDAQTIKTKAQAQADAQRLQQRSLTPEYLQLQAIQKWDGKLPNVTGGAMPFINADAAKATK